MTEFPERFSCEVCFGIGFVFEESDGSQQVKKCVCRVPLAAPAPDPLDACGIPHSYAHCTLANFQSRSSTLIDAYGATRSYFEHFPYAGEHAGLGLLFWGSANTGKTHLAVAVLKELIAERHVTGAFWNFARLLRQIARSYDPRTYTTEMSVLASTLDVDVLVLDDLGSKRIADWALDTLFYIVNSRYSMQKTTIVTTRYEDASPEQVRRSELLRREEFLLERIGPATRSRLLEMCVWVPMQSDRERLSRRQPYRPSTLRGIRGEGGA
jgi:DNA replication protein DnaC